MREIKIKYYLKSVQYGDYCIERLELEDIENGCLEEMMAECSGFIVAHKEEYTQCKDNSNIEIYKNDILESASGDIYLVDFKDGSYVIVHAPDCRAEAEGEYKTDILNKSCIEFYKLDITGNIHEHKELLND